MDRSIARMITLLARKSQCYIGSALQKYGLTAGEQPFFMALQKYEGVTQEELTTLVSVDKAATARAVKSMEEKGFLTRVPDKLDRRQNRIYPTDKAKRLAGDVKKELLHFNSLLTQGISPQDLEIISAGLQTMEENFSAISGGKNAAVRESGGQNNGRTQ